MVTYASSVKLMTYFTELKTKLKPSLRTDMGIDSENIQSFLDFGSLWKLDENCGHLLILCTYAVFTNVSIQF